MPNVIPKPVFDRKHHKEMWLWLANNPCKSKQEWPGWKKLGYTDMQLARIHYCFACEYNKAMAVTREHACEFCPLQFPYVTMKKGYIIQQGTYSRIYAACETESSVYLEWRYTINEEVKSELAKMIANLDLHKEDDICIK